LGSKVAPLAGAFIVSADHRVLAWSEALEAATGLKPEHAIGRFCWEALNAVDEAGRAVCARDCVLAREAMAAGRAADVEIRLGPGARAKAALSTYGTRAPLRQVVVHVLVSHTPARREADRVLSPRQLEIVRLLAAGRSTEEIALSLRITRPTTRNHINAVIRRLGARSRIEAVARARDLGLVT